MKTINLDSWQKFLDLLNIKMKSNPPFSINLEELSEELDVPVDQITFFSKMLSSFYGNNNLTHNSLDIKPTSKDLEVTIKPEETKEVTLTQETYQIISDLIYFFKNINKGRGFEIYSDKDSSLHNKIKKLSESYPFFFRKLNGFLYPSEVLYRLGTEAMSYKRSNQVPKELTILRYRFVIEK